jgi:hypothetical protein
MIHPAFRAAILDPNSVFAWHNRCKVRAALRARRHVKHMSDDALLSRSQRTVDRFSHILSAEIRDRGIIAF